MRKIVIACSFIIIMMISFLGITYSYEYNEVSDLKFELFGDYIVDLNLGGTYIEEGFNVTYNGENINSEVVIESSLDNLRVGEYKIKYIVNIDGVDEYVYRVINVRENIKPEIILKGDSSITVDVFGVYEEPGYEVRDNYDMNLNDKVVITSDIDVNNVGEYVVTYTVSDSSGNTTSVSRVVIVK